MKISIFLSRLATLSFALRNMFVAGFFVFSAALGQAQNSTVTPAQKQANSNTENTEKQLLPSVIGNNQKAITTDHKAGSLPLKVTEPAPDINDPDYVTKKETGINEYPEEYKANNARPKSITSHHNITFSPKSLEKNPNLTAPDSCSKKREEINNCSGENNSAKQQTYQKSINNGSNKNIANGNTENTFQKRIGEHGPYINDKDLDTKIQEWKFAYPEEYMEYRKNNPDPNVYKGSVIIPAAYESSTNAAKCNNKVAENAPNLDDPEYEIKKAEWIKKYPEEYRQLLPASTDNRKEKN